ncbi:MAG: hypothetical protein WC518_01095 [Patescibacteria group bacterium]
MNINWASVMFWGGLVLCAVVFLIDFLFLRFRRKTRLVKTVIAVAVAIGIVLMLVANLMNELPPP